MRGMKRDLDTKTKKKLVLAVVLALVIAAIVAFVIVPASTAKWKGFIFFTIFIAISGIGVFTAAKSDNGNGRY